MSRITGSQYVHAFITRASGLLLSVVVTSLAARLLLPEKFGQYALIVSLVTILSVPSTLGLRQLVTRETAYSKAHDDTGRATAVWLWSMRLSLQIAAVFAIGLVAWSLLSGVESDIRWQFVIGAGMLLLAPIAKIFSGVLQGFGKVAASQITEVVARPLFMSSLLLLSAIMFEPGTPKVAWILGFMCIAMVAEAGVGAMFLGFGEISRALRPHARLQRTESRKLLIAAISFGAISGVQIINSNLDILMIAALKGPYDTGLYRASTSLAGIASFGLVVVNLVIMPRIAALHRSGNRAALQDLLFRSVVLITVTALAGGIIVFLGGKLMLNLIFGEDYADAYRALVILAGGQLANAFFGPVALILNMTGREKFTLMGVSIAALANIALNLTLIPRYGIEGAAFATAFSLFLWNIVLAIVLKTQTGLNCTILQWKSSGAET